MNERTGTTKILQQNVPSSSKGQSGKLYQNKEAIATTFTGKYMDRAQNSNASPEIPCKDTFISYKQIFKEAKELHRQKMANNNLLPPRKSCNIVSYTPKKDLFGSSHNIYPTESKSMARQQKSSKEGAEKYKKTTSKNNIVKFTFHDREEGVLLINRKSSYHDEGSFSNNDIVLDTQRHKLMSKMDGVKTGPTQAVWNRCETVAQRQHKNTTNSRQVLRKCKYITAYIN